MKLFDHPFYRDISNFMNAYELRFLRKKLRRCDRILVVEAKKRGDYIPVEIRMRMVYESELKAQDERHAIISAPIEVAKNSNGFTVAPPDKEITGG